MSDINPVTELVTALTGKINLENGVEDVPVVDIIELDGSETYRLDAQEQIVRVLSGRAWITVNAEDRIVGQDEDTFIEVSKEQAIISSVNHRPLVFEIQYI